MSIRIQNETGLEFVGDLLRFGGMGFRVTQDASGDIVVTKVDDQARCTVAARSDVNVNVGAAPNTIGGRVIAGGDFLWLNGQTNPEENGIHVVSRKLYAGHYTLTKCQELTELTFSSKPLYIKVLYGTFAKRFFRLQADDGIREIDDPGLDWMVVDVGDFMLDSDPTDSDAIERAHDSGAGLITFYRQREYNLGRGIVLKRKVNLQGLCTTHVQNNTRIRIAEGNHGLRALFGDTTPDTQGGWASVSGLWLDYEGSPTDEEDWHGIMLDTPCNVSDCTVQDFPGHGMNISADLGSHTGANLCHVNNLEVFWSGLSGIYAAGADSNACIFLSPNIMAAGRRFFGVVKARYVLRLTNTRPTDTPLALGRQVFEDKRWGMFYESVAFPNGNVIPANGTLDIEVVAGITRFGTLEAALKIVRPNGYLGAGTQFGVGVEYNQPIANEITSIVYADEGLHLPGSGVTVTNLSGPSIVAQRGDCAGIREESFLGNSFYAAHSTAPGGRHYEATKASGAAIFSGCYCETGNFGEVRAPNMVDGGFWADPPGMQSSGFLRDTSAFRIAPFYVDTQGRGKVRFYVGRQGTDEVLRVLFGSDPNPLLLMGDCAGGRLDRGFGFMYANRQLFGFTRSDDLERGVAAVAPEGVVVGNPGVRISSGLVAVPGAIPVQYTRVPLESPTAGGVTYKVNDVYFDHTATAGQAWMYRCSTRTLIPGSSPPRYALTWDGKLFV